MHFPLGLISFICSARYVIAAVDPATLSQHLANGAEVLGSPVNSDGLLTKWMGTLDDSLPIEQITIPGTHDSLTWGIKGLTASFVQTQDKTLFEQLDAGIRFFDLRIGLNGGKVNMYHGSAILSQTATLEDVFWGFYSWIDTHPTETLIISVKVDSGPTGIEVQQPVYDLITTGVGATYWLQTDTLGTLGSSRGKLIFFRRMVISAVPDAKAIGIPASDGWADNNAAFSITNGAKSIWIEDFYDVPGGTVAPSVDQKTAAVTGHLDLARASTDASQMYVTFASGYSGLSVNPKQLATGNETASVPGVNAGVQAYMIDHKGDHKGVVLYDFFASEYGLINATLGYDITAPPPSSTSNPSNTKNNAFKTSLSSPLFIICPSIIFGTIASILLHL